MDDFCQETGETNDVNYVCFSCTRRTIDAETGEYLSELAPTRPPFRINGVLEAPPTAEKPLPPPRCTCRTTAIFCLLFLCTLSVCRGPPGLLATIWLVLEFAFHLYSHKKKTSHFRHSLFLPQPANLFAHLCPLCQTQERMNLVGKLHQRRHNRHIAHHKVSPYSLS